MSLQKSVTSRRAFLGGLGAAGAVGASRTFSGSLLASGGAAQNEGPTAKLLPHYVYGEVADQAPDRLTIQLPEEYSPSKISVALTSRTEICRLGCNRTWRDLKVGDRVETGFDGVLGTNATAMWVNANPVYNYGFVTQMGVTSQPGPGGAERGWPLITVVINSGDYDQKEFHRDITIAPATKLVRPTGHEAFGAVGAIKVGSFVSFTATADVPYLRCRSVWGTTINQYESQ